ncbi:hypothetical protein [Methanolapillus ohkumae]|uniref:Tetratricopeptide repeat protein n=1 Tax=Methanolapillus ohkumae TaxID=3028298 RepID=A0AA96V7G7_9EURY|nr:hypothetical protein MsAm2_08150 [Methanosarcinaceae archaeon Am2]
MSSFNPQKPVQKKEIDFDLIHQCLEDGRFSEASLLLTAGEKSSRPDVLFNTGICFLQAGDFTSAVTVLESAVVEIKKLGPKSKIMKNDLYKKLRVSEIDDGIYLKPMDMNYVETFLEIAQENVLLALKDAYLGCGLTDKARGVVGSLVGDEFAALKKQF